MFHDPGKSPWAWKSSMTMGNLHHSGKVSWGLKSSMILKKFHKCGSVCKYDSCMYM